MAHQEQVDFCQEVRKKFPDSFRGVDVLEVGSHDVNGTVRGLFLGCRYTGIDLFEEEGVDVVGHLCDLDLGSYHTVISTNAMEHDMRWRDSISKMGRLTRNGGLLVITCSAPGYEDDRPHGTRECSPHASMTSRLEGDAGSWFKNLSPEDLWSALRKEEWEEWTCEVRGAARAAHTLCFWGVKAATSATA